MEVKTETTENGFIAYLAGEIDHHTAKPIREQIDGLCQRTRPREVTLDFGGVTFMDSSGVGLVMGRYRLLAEWGGRVKVANMPPYIEKVMKLAGLEKLRVF